MEIAVATIFPEIIRAYLGESIIKRAQDAGLVSFEIVDFRGFATDRHRTVDDSPFGGGPGMVIKPEPLVRAVERIKSDGKESHTIVLSPEGTPFTQKRARELACYNGRLIFVCGRYEGIDERARRRLADEVVSIGDYVLTGGELPALVIIDALVRLMPGALGDETSAEEESFEWGLLDYPHYTRPRVFEGSEVPDVLLCGNHAEIKKWRRREALRRTMMLRPDLIERLALSEEDKKIIKEISEEEDGSR